MLYNEQCKTGQLQATATTVKVVSFKRVVWATPRNSITYIALKRGVVMTELTIFTAHNHYPASLGNQLAEKFLALFSGVPRGAPLTVQPQTFDPGDDFIIQCQDGTYSQSGGERGACSSHGGEASPLYAH